MTTDIIAYWLDRTSDPGESHWVISRERQDTSTTLRVLPDGSTEATARLVALALAAGYGLTVERH